MHPLHYKIFGDRGPPLLILHGLFGSLENWASQAKAFSRRFVVVAVDLRNHGRSPHVADMGYDLMADDILRLLLHLGIDKAHLIGHSMGGKTAMQFALNHAAHVDKLIVVDIAPKRYPRHHDKILDALMRIDLDKLQSRNEADAQIESAVPEPAIRSFLLKNLQRGERGFIWKINLPVLRDDYDKIAAAVHAKQPFLGETLLIKGGNSEYVLTGDEAEITRFFPNVRAVSIQNTGHWPHVEKATVFGKIAGDFLL
jgi:esterase